MPPVLLILFNRSDTTLQVLERVKGAGIQKLYIYSDGPRTEKQGEAETLQKVQREILSAINWPCEVFTAFQLINEGPRLAIGHAISWFFTYEPEGIILEHDCVPDLTFFSYCGSLLAKYRDDERIMHISGNNFQFGVQRGDGSYYFSLLNHIWGFATWRRAWQLYDVNMSTYPAFKESKQLERLLPSAKHVKIWTDIFDRTYAGELATWDYQWLYAMWCNHGLAILPNQNLVSNVGFDAAALNTTNPNHRLANMKTDPMPLELVHPTFMVPNKDADDFSMKEVFFPTKLRFVIQSLKTKLNLPI